MAQQTIALVETNKAKMKAEVEQMLQDSQKEIDELKSLAAKAIRKKTFTACEEIQGMIGKWEIDLVNIKEKVQGQQVKQAYDETKAVKEQVANHKQKVEGQIPAKPEKK